MIIYVTGAPGSGKTLWTMSTVAKRAKEEGREVYYYNIPNVNVPGQQWHELTKQQAMNPHDLPQGSIIVVDEAWELWPQSKAGVKVPEHIELFATHRHRGHDFFIMTQRTTSVHHFIRGLIGQHVHFERQFGLPRARRFEWQRLGNPSDKWDKDAASSSEFIYPKEVFNWYKSSDQHTVKVRLPWFRLGGIAALVVGIALLGWSVVYRVSSLDESTRGTSEAVERLGDLVEAGNKETADKLAHLEAQLLGAEWSARFQPRVPGVPMSASFYDQQVRPASVPRISGCYRIQLNHVDRCRCTTQQGSVIGEISHAQCLYYVRNGWYDPLRADEPEHMPGGEGSARADSGAAAAPPPITAGESSTGLGGGLGSIF